MAISIAIRNGMTKRMKSKIEEYISNEFPLFSHKKQVDAVKLLNALYANPNRTISTLELATISGAEPFRIVPILYEFSLHYSMVRLLFSNNGELYGAMLNSSNFIALTDN